MKLKKHDDEPKLKDNKPLYILIAILALIAGNLLFDFIAALF